MSRFQIPTRLRPIPALMLALLTQPNLAGVAPTDADEMLSNASIADMTDSEPSASERGTSSDPGPAPPALMLAQVYAPGIDVSGYWVSEKLDGVRAYWDGTRLVSRGGHGIRAPAWFVASFPSEPLDGELWMGRGRFEELSGTVRRLESDDDVWREVRYLVFDLPALPMPFEAGWTGLGHWCGKRDNPRLSLVEQVRVRTARHDGATGRGRSVRAARA